MLFIALSRIQRLFLVGRSRLPDGINCPLTYGMLSFGNNGRVTSLGVRRVKAVLDQWVRDPPG